jgi:hypothetical protein
VTPLATLLTTSGLSQDEAARFLDLRSRANLTDMLRGKSATPPGVMLEMAGLVNRQLDAAGAFAEQVEAIVQPNGPPGQIELGYPADDHEAQTMGWPTVSAWRAMAGLALADMPRELLPLVRLVPRGSTPATAAAADQRES